MKMRIRGNSIRVRLTQSEVKRVGDGEPVQETIEFARGARLHYVLEPSGEVNAVEARFVDHRVSILVPTAAAKAWAKSNEVSLKFEQELAEANSDQATPPRLFILVEKDFVCLKPRVHESEDESDLFANPNEVHGSCGGAHV